MATIVLSAAGMALGGSIGGSVLGLSMATIGRAAGATLGRVIDQRILGAGSEPVEVGRVDRFRLTAASEGTAVGQIYGRMRVAGQVIWATRFLETSTNSGGGKGAGPQSSTTEFSYAVSLAIALCEGEITRVGRVWADGVEIATDTLNMRVYKGGPDQLPDPKMAAVQGADNVPAYRGLAYVVLEDLPLDLFGNRVPQFTFEVMRPSETGTPPERADIARQVQGVALIPGTGEYSLATTPAYLGGEFAESTAINVNSPSGGTDFTTAVTALNEELPECGSVSLVVSWFGSDLRCGDCDVAPKVEQKDAEAEDMPWLVAGEIRATAGIVPLKDGRPVYGGTPADSAVVEAIKDLNTSGLRPVFYPFILMEQLDGNTLPDPYSDASTQPSLPWRGRITTAKSPGQSGTSDQTATAEAEVATFMGTASPSDFTINGEAVDYTGPAAWRYRRFILHYANLSVAAGGVSAFCIGSEMRGLTQIRGAGGSFPAVDALRTLAAEVRAIVGPGCKISYAADWSEYHGYQPAGTNDKLFHLDPLWTDPAIDFIGIDNYMPLSDWRDGLAHRDAQWGSIYNLQYLQSNVAGGEGYDWFYHSPEARAGQIRTAISDGDGEPWVWRYKDLIGWWSNPHHERIDGVRQASATAWQPQSKPFWFTEFGCAAIDKGTNQPNKFLDPKSSESQLPHYSNGMRDDFMQMQYLRAIYGHFADSAHNPESSAYVGQMLDMTRAHVWAWDARPFPYFPANGTLWSDGDNYARGHWLNGRSSARTLASVVADVCEKSGVTQYDVSKLYGLVRGYSVSDVTTARSALQPLLVAYGIEAVERNGTLVFTNRDGLPDRQVSVDQLAYDPERGTDISHTRAPAAEVAGRVQIGYLDAESDYEMRVAETIHPDDETYAVTRSEMPLALTRTEASRIVDRWTHEARVAKDSVSFALPPSQTDVQTGDVIDLTDDGDAGLYRIDRIEESGLRLAEATRVDPEIYRPVARFEEGATLRPHVGPTPVEMLFLDLPLLTGDEAPASPYIAATARPWPGTVALYSATQDNDYILQNTVRQPAIIGVTQTALTAGPLGRWDRQAGLTVRLVSGALSSATSVALLGGANTLAIGDGSTDRWEILQFAEATPVDTRSFALQRLLRGQAGSDSQMPDVWTAGSMVVVLNGGPKQIVVPTASRGLPRHYRFGPVKRPVSDPSFRHKLLTFLANSYRPYAVTHLRATPDPGGAQISWIRRTRIDGDIWGQTEVPLGEDSEDYVLEIRSSGMVVRAAALTSPAFAYTDAMRASDVGTGGYTVAVAQVSNRYGTGPFREHFVAP